MVQRLPGLHVDHPLTISRLTLQISLEDTEVALILAVAPLYKYRRIRNLIRYVFAPVLMIQDTRRPHSSDAIASLWWRWLRPQQHCSEACSCCATPTGSTTTAHARASSTFRLLRFPCLSHRCTGTSWILSSALSTVFTTAAPAFQAAVKLHKSTVCLLCLDHLRDGEDDRQ